LICKINGATIRGIDACMVTVETDIGDGLPSFEMVGLLSSEVKESRERVRTALKNSGYMIPPKRITINLSPGDIRKSGTGFDLPIAISLLLGLGIINNEDIDSYMFAGELSLDGEIVSIEGVFSIVLKAIELGIKRVFIPEGNLHECDLINNVEVIGVRDLKEVIYILSTGELSKEHKPNYTESTRNYAFDFRDLKGQAMARRGALIAAAGRHNFLMIGSPGSGKSMLAKCFPSILPQMTLKEKIEVAKIYSVAGLYDGRRFERPFRNPHHTCTLSSMIGSGLNPRPGEITLAHNGVLFLDELPEFSRQVIEVLRQPLEEKNIVISRAGGKYCFPADFMLLAACNPCRCGYYPDRNKCKCTEHEVTKYMRKISGPILDRIDLCVNVSPVKYQELQDECIEESSSVMKLKVEIARQIQEERYRDMDIDYNGQLDGRDIKEYCYLDKKEQEMMKKVFERFSLSVRGYNKILKVARTIADLSESNNIERNHLMEAISYRNIV